MPKNPRVYELARELGLSNKETLDLCDALGIGVKSHSSSVQEAQADRVRRKADREGLIRAQQPQEEDEQPKPAKKKAPVKKAVAKKAPAKKAPAKKAPAKKAAPVENAEVLEDSAVGDSTESPKPGAKLAPASTVSPSSPKDDEPANDPTATSPETDTRRGWNCSGIDPSGNVSTSSASVLVVLLLLNCDTFEFVLSRK